jgi:uncharacterized protein (DUF1015 family)
MAIIKPFKALRPQPQLAKQVASRPYDVLSSAEAKLEARGNHSSFLHITKSEIDLPDTVDVHDASVYEQAKENLAAFIQRDVVFREEQSLLLYLPADHEWPRANGIGVREQRG